MKLAGYIRVSVLKGREGDSFLSPSDQRRQIEGHAVARGHEVVEWFEDLGQSGGDFDRPSFARLMEYVLSGKADGIIVAKLDRFARTVVGALQAIEDLNDADKKLICVQEGFDPSTPYGEAFMSIALVFAKLELDRIKAGWRTTLENVVEVRGIQPTIAPFGYRKDATKKFEPDPVEAPFVKGIYERRAKGDTWKSIAEWLNESDAKPRRANQWAPRTVKDMTKNVVYLGVVRKGDLRKDNAHPALVSESLWAKVQDVTGHGTHRATGEGYPLRGLVRCAGCSRTMGGGGYKRKGKPNVLQYHCTVNHGDGKCPAPANINNNIVVPWVEEEFFAMLKDRQGIPTIDVPALEEATEARMKAEKTRNAYRGNTELLNILGAKDFSDGLRPLQAVYEAAIIAEEEARKSASGVDLPPVDSLRDAWSDLTVTERRRILAQAIDGVFVKRGRGLKPNDRCKIVWKGDLKEKLSSAGVSVPLREFAF